MKHVALPPIITKKSVYMRKTNGKKGEYGTDMKVNLSILHAFFHGTLYIQMSNKRTLRTGCACVIGDEIDHMNS